MSDLIQEVKAALKAATPGPWVYEEAFADEPDMIMRPDNRTPIAEFGYQNGDNDAKLLTNAPTWLQQLMDMVEELEEELNQERSGREAKSEIGQVNPQVRG